MSRLDHGDLDEADWELEDARDEALGQMTDQERAHYENARDNRARASRSRRAMERARRGWRDPWECV